MTAFLIGQKEKGNISDFEPVALEEHGGDLNGFVLIRGEQSKLWALRTSDRYVALVQEAGFSVSGLGTLGAWTGEAFFNPNRQWQEMIPG